MKNTRSLVNIGMVIFLSIFITIFYTLNKTADETLQLSILSVDEIKRIEIIRPQGKSILFEKASDSLWHMSKPYQLKAHQFRINTLLSLTQMPVTKFYDIKALDLSQYSLDKPRAKIKFNDTEILFGKTNALNGMRYFLSQNKMTFLSDQIYPLVSAQASSFIDLSLLPDDYAINQIITPAINILLNNDLQWINAESKSTKSSLNADQIQTLLQNWNDAQAFAVHKYLPRKQLGKIEIRSATKILTYQITDDTPWLILALPDLNIEYHLDASQKDRLYGIISVAQPDA